MDIDRSIFLPSHHLFEGPFLKNVYYAKNAIFFKALQIRRMISQILSWIWESVIFPRYDTMYQILFNFYKRFFNDILGILYPKSVNATSLIFTLLIYSFWNYTSKIMWAKNIKWEMRGKWSKSQNPHWYCWSYFNTVKEPQGVLYKWDVGADTDIRLLKNPPKLQRWKKKQVEKTECFVLVQSCLWRHTAHNNWHSQRHKTNHN